MQQIHDLIIIGGGMTGLTAAICAGAAEMDVLVIDRNEKPGGSLLNEELINHYPALPKISGEELVSMILDHCELYGVHFVRAKVDRIDADAPILSVWAGKKEFTATAVLLACGTPEPELLSTLPSELTADGQIFADSAGRTVFPYVYAAGDARKGSLSGILNAAAEAENSINSFLDDIK